MLNCFHVRPSADMFVYSIMSYFMKIDVVGGASSHIFQLGNSFLRLLSSYNGREIISQEIMKYKLFLNFYSKNFPPTI